MKNFGLLGEHLSHSFSPMIHAMLGDYDYHLYEKSPVEVGYFLDHGDFDGLNVTIPYKKTAVPYCAALSENAQKIGSVNTVVRRPDGMLLGDNTDYDGFLFLLEKLYPGLSKDTLAGKKALVLGSGGASLTTVTVLAGLGAVPVVISRTGEDNYENVTRRHTDASLIVNTTPVGMYPDNGGKVLELGAFGACRAVADIVYNPSRTALLLDAEDMGIPCINGLPMLVAQARRAAELFTGEKIGSGVIDDITGRIERMTRNVVLIGMPGSGKSTTGAALARLLCREFFDTDVLVEQAAGKCIPDIFRDEGEDAFRALETDALRTVSKRSGAVISTGGGIVKRPQNRRLLRQNSHTVYLERPLEALSSDGRPLSQRDGVAALFKERQPLYEKWCDIRVSAVGVDETAIKIKELIGL